MSDADDLTRRSEEILRKANPYGRPRVAPFSDVRLAEARVRRKYRKRLDADDGWRPDPPEDGGKP